MFHLQQNDALLAAGLKVAALSGAGIVLLVVALLLIESAPLVERIGVSRFFTDASWHPTSGEFNLAPMVVASLLITFGSLGLAVPVALLSAIFCNYYAPVALAALYRRMLEIAGGMPTIVYGYWGLVTLVPIIAQLGGPGTSLLAASIVLALMILPTILLMIDASIVAVPTHYLHSAVALGIGRSATVRKLVVPIIRRGIVAATILGATRAIGETMVVLMVSGNIVQVPASLLEPVRALTANIALEMAYAVDDHRAALFVSGLLLMGMVVALVIAGERVADGFRDQ